MTSPQAPTPGPGWWMAADGELYPPELHPDFATPPQGAPAPGLGRPPVNPTVARSCVVCGTPLNARFCGACGADGDADPPSAIVANLAFPTGPGPGWWIDDDGHPRPPHEHAPAAAPHTASPPQVAPARGPNEWFRSRPFLIAVVLGVLALGVASAFLISTPGNTLRRAAGLRSSEWSTTRQITSESGIPFKMQIALVGLSIDPNDKYCAPTTSPGKSNALMEVTWTNDSDRAAKLPGTTIDMNASADPGSSFLADSIRFRPCGLGVGTSSTPLEPGQSVTVRGAFAGVPESGVSGFYLIIYGGDGGFYGKALDTVQIESSESGDTPTAAETIRTCTAESDRIEAALKKWSKDKKGEYSGPVTIDELVPEYLPKRPTLYEYAPGGYPSDIGRGVVAYGSLTANPPCTQDRPFIPFVYGG